MADGTRQLTINISVNSARAVSSLKSLKSALGEVLAGSAVSGVAAAGAQTEAATKKATTAVQALGAAMQPAAKNATVLSTAVASASAPMKGLVNMYQQGNGVQNQWSESTRAATPIVKGLAAAMGSAAAATAPMVAATTTAAPAAQRAATTYQQYNSALQMFSATTRAANPVFTTLAQAQTAMATSTTNAIAPAQRAATTYQQYNSAIQQFSMQTRAATPIVDGWAAAERKATATAQQMSTSLGRLRVSLEGNADSMDAARRSAYALTIAGFQLKMAGEAITSSIMGAVGALSEFDFTARRAAGALAIMDSSSAMFTNLGESVQQAAIQVKLFKPEEVAKGLYYWGSTTGQVVKTQDELNKVMQQTVPIMKAAAMTEVSMERALKGVYQIISQYNMGIDDAADVTEKLFYLTQKTAVEMPDLLESFKMMGPIAATFKVSFEDVTKTLGVLGNLGIKGSMAGRALGMMFSKIAEPTEAATKALDAFSKKAGYTLSFQNVIFPEGKFIGMQGFLNVLTRMTKDLTDQERLQFMALITTQNEWRALQPLLDANTRALADVSNGGKGVIDMADDLSGAAKYTADAWELMGGSVKATFGELSNKIAPLLFKVGEAAMKVLVPMAKTIGDIAVSVASWAQANPAVFSLIVQIVALGGAITTAMGSMMLFVGAWKLIVNVAFPTIALDFVKKLGLGMGAAAKEAALLDGALTGVGKKGGIVSTLLAPLKHMLNTITGAFSSVGKQLLGVIGPQFAKLGAAVGGLFATAYLKTLIAVDAMKGWWAKNVAMAGVQGALAGRAFAIAAAAAALVAPAIAVLVVWNVAQDQQRQVDEAGDALLAQAKEFAAKATPEQLQNAINGVKGQLDGMVFNSYDSKNKVIAVLNSLLEESNMRALSARDALKSAFKFEENDKNVGDSATNLVTAFYARATAESIAQAALNKETVSTAISMMFSGDIKAQRYGQEALRSWVAGMRSGVSENLRPAVQAMYDSAVEMMASNDPRVRSAGNRTMIELANAIQSGSQTKVQNAFRSVIATAQNLLDSTSPKMRASGYKMLMELAQGLRKNKNLDPAVRTQLYSAIKMLQSGTERFQLIGSSYVLSLVNGMIAQEGQVIAEARKIRQLAAKTLGGEKNIDKAEGAAAERLGIRSTPFDLSAFLGFDQKDEEEKGGGGGGSAAEKKESPLTKALEVAKNAAELAEALQKVAGLDVKAMVQKSMKPLAEAMLLADKITYQVTKSFGMKKIKEVAEFSDASQKVASLIGTAAEAFGKMADFKRPSNSSLKGIVDLVATVNKYVGDVAKKVKVETLASAVIFSDAASKVLSMIGGALDTMSKITEEMPAMPNESFWTNLVSMILDITKKVGEASKMIDSELSKAAKDFADNAGSVMTLMGNALEAFSKGEAFAEPTEQVVNSIKESIRLSVNAIKSLSEEMKIDPKVMTSLSAFAQSVGAIVGAIKSTAQAFMPLKQEIIDPEKETWVPVVVQDQIGRMKQSLDAIRGLVDGIDTGTLKSMEKLAGIAEKVGSTIKNFFDMAQPIKTEDGAAGATQFANLGAVVSDVLGGIFRAMMNFSMGFNAAGTSMISNLVAGMQSQQGALAATVASINATLAGVGGTSVVTFNVATTARPVQVEHTIKGDVGSLTAQQIADILNSGDSMATNIAQAAGTA